MKREALIMDFLPIPAAPKVERDAFLSQERMIQPV
jgi:hypothetical protein